MKIAISGAGVAGTTLAWWLERAGHEALLIERAPAPRGAGYLIDFWGVGYTVAERMGLLPAIREAGYDIEDVRFVADDGSKVGGFAVDALRNMVDGRLTSLARGALALSIWRAIERRVETLFDDRIEAIDDSGEGVRIKLESGARRDVDLVIGADGLHSRVRELIFGPERRFETDLGYRFAVFDCAGYQPRDEQACIMHSATGRQIARFALRDGRTLVLMVFRSDLLNGVEPEGTAQAQALLKTVFDDAGWESRAILAAMPGAADFYYDRVSQIRMPAWHSGRVALVGDAGAAVSFLAGEGAGLAMTEAYVLAGELARAGGDHTKAFAAYDARLRPFIEGKQFTAANFASTFVPQTEFGIWLRNQASRSMVFPGLAHLLMGKTVVDDFALPDYA